MSSQTVWAFRLLALSSTAAMGVYLYPTIDTTPPRHAVMLAQSQEAILARTGCRRVERHARRGGENCDLLVKAGVVQALREAMSREDVSEAAVQAVRALKKCPGEGVRQLVALVEEEEHGRL